MIQMMIYLKHTIHIIISTMSADDDLSKAHDISLYQLCRPISCWLSSLVVEYHLLWTIIRYIVWHSPPVDDFQLKQMILIWRGWYSSKDDNIQLKQMILIWRGRYSSRADAIFIRWKRYSFKRDEYHLWWLVLEFKINHWRWYSTTGDHNQPLGMIINQWRW
jgi:hypothetical protein